VLTTRIATSRTFGSSISVTCDVVISSMIISFQRWFLGALLGIVKSVFALT
jgi:hypothetical protein